MNLIFEENAQFDSIAARTTPMRATETKTGKTKARQFHPPMSLEVNRGQDGLTWIGFCPRGGSG
jgi:hypothetical protein